MKAVSKLAASFFAVASSFCGPDWKHVQDCDRAYQECVKDATTKAEYLECRSQADEWCDP